MWTINEDTDLNSSWHASLRRVWMSDRLFYDWPVEAFAWAPNEKYFWVPMTKPALSDSQYTMLIADYVSYLVDLTVMDTRLSRSKQDKVEKTIVHRVVEAMTSANERT